MMQTQPTQPKALRLADWLQAAVQIYPQRSEDDPGGYASEVDQVMDEAAAELRRLHALTQGTQPTDDELKELIAKEMIEYSEGAYSDHGSARSQLEYFARAALAKWGTPATGGEPVACNCKATDMRIGVCCKVRAAFEEWYDQQQDGRIQPFDVWLAAWKGGRKSVGTSPQPVREPLNIVELMRVVMKADEETRGNSLRGTTNWAAHIGKAVQNAVLSITGGQT